MPVSDPADPTPTFLALESADVVHSFWVPRLAGKTDLIPNRTNAMWIDPREPGLYLGQCAEYCGTQHAHMLLRVVVQPRDEFERWVAAQTASPRPPIRRAARGPAGLRDDGLHQLPHRARHGGDGPLRTGPHAPDEPRHARRRRRAEPAENLRAWIDDPDRVKPGALMPAMKLDDAASSTQLVAYLATLR